MKLKTHQFGEIDYSEENVLEFGDGIIGFENFKKYVLLNQGDGLFLWLTSVDEPEIIFPLFAVRLLQENYPEEEDYEAFAIVKMNRDPLKITANLKAPIYINQESKKGFQKILDAETLPVAFKLFVETN